MKCAGFVGGFRTATALGARRKTNCCKAGRGFKELSVLIYRHPFLFVHHPQRWAGKKSKFNRLPYVLLSVLLSRINNLQCPLLEYVSNYTTTLYSSPRISKSEIIFSMNEIALSLF